jgi:hypothetical protein
VEASTNNHADSRPSPARDGVPRQSGETWKESRGGSCQPDGSLSGVDPGRGSPTPAAGEVLNTHVIGKMTQRVLVENWPAERAVEEAHKAIAEIYARHAKA